MIAGFLNNPTGDVAFGQALSIGEDLGGAANAILFICNRVTYGQPCYGSTGYLTRYWPNRQRWIDYRAGLTELLEGMSKDSSLFWSPLFGGTTLCVHAQQRRLPAGGSGVVRGGWVTAAAGS